MKTSKQFITKKDFEKADAAGVNLRVYLENPTVYINKKDYICLGKVELYSSNLKRLYIYSIKIRCEDDTISFWPCYSSMPRAYETSIESCIIKISSIETFLYDTVKNAIKD